MILFVFLGYAFWGYVMLRLLLRRPLQLVEYVVAYPSGLAASGLVLFAGWASAIPFSILTVFWWLVAIAGAIFWLFAKEYRALNFSEKMTIRLVKKLKDLRLRFSEWPWLYMAAVIVVSLLVAVVWQFFFRPVSWDAVALYDFRAWRIVDGWFPADFMTQFSRLPEYQAYDFLHPMTSSLWWAVAYQSGATGVLWLYSLLLIHVWLLGFFIWKHVSTRILWIFLWISMPALFVSLTEGYGAYPATLFWTLGLLWWELRRKQHRMLTFSDWGVWSLFVLGSVSGRVTEYYWGVLLLVSAAYIFWQNKFQMVKNVKNIFSAWLLPGISLWLWFAMRSQAVTVSGSQDADRSMQALVAGFSEFSLVNIVNAVAQEAVPWITSPVSPWIVLLIIGVMVWKRQRQKMDESWWLWLSLMVGCFLILLLGMVALNIVFGDRWVEARQALDRAVLPILAICFVWLSDLTERISPQE